MRFLICDCCKKSDWRIRPIAGLVVCQPCLFRFWNSGLLENKTDKEKRKIIVNYYASQTDTL